MQGGDEGRGRSGKSKERGLKNEREALARDTARSNGKNQKKSLRMPGGGVRHHPLRSQRNMHQKKGNRRDEADFRSSDSCTEKGILGEGRRRRAKE